MIQRYIQVKAITQKISCKPSIFDYKRSYLFSSINSLKAYLIDEKHPFKHFIPISSRQKDKMHHSTPKKQPSKIDIRDLIRGYYYGYFIPFLNDTYYICEKIKYQ